MKLILKASVVCAMLIVSTLTHADEYADLRKSTANMTKEEAKKVEAGAVPVAVYAYYTGASYVLPAVTTVTMAASRTPNIPNPAVLTTGKAVKAGYEYVTSSPKTLYKAKPTLNRKKGNN